VRTRTARAATRLPGGIGGSTRSGSLKCLHAHAAFALARPGYELGERILAELDHLWPDSGCCHRDSDLTGNAGHAPDNVTGQTTSLTRMPIALDQTRREWELGHRRFQQEVREGAP